MGRKWTFGWDDSIGVEVPMLDSFIEEFEALLKRYDLGFEKEYRHSDDGGEYVILTTWKKADISFLFDHLDESKGPEWLEAGRKRYDLLAKERERRDMEARMQKQELEARALVERGMVLAGKKYRLVPED